MDDFDLTNFNARFGRAAPPAPRWHEHGECSRCCPCWARGRNEEKQSQRDLAAHDEARKREAEMLREEREMRVCNWATVLALAALVAVFIWREWPVWGR